MSRIQNQNQKIIKYLKRHPKGITQADAIKLGCYRLSARIFDIKELGYNITTTIEENIHADGSVSRFARYYLHGEKV